MNLLKSLRIIGDDSKVSFTSIAVITGVIHVGANITPLSFLLLAISIAFYQTGELIESLNHRRAAAEDADQILERVGVLETRVAELSLVKAFKGGGYGG